MEQHQGYVDKARLAVTNFVREFEADKAVLTVAKTDNYEGNIVSYIGLRWKGEENVAQYRVFSKLEGSVLTVVKTEPLE